MELYKITKGNFCLNATKDKRPHENNLRFHIRINDKHYEYAIDCINKSTINIRCVVGKTKTHEKCYARLTLLPGDYLKTEKKPCNSKRIKFRWSSENVETDYYDVRNFIFSETIQW